MKNVIKFVLDDKIVEVDFTKHPELKPTTTVLNYLRSYPTHKGVKEGCAEGDCGACTIVLSELCDNKLKYKTIDSCLVFLPMIHGKQLITVENLAIKKERNSTSPCPANDGRNQWEPVWVLYFRHRNVAFRFV